MIGIAVSTVSFVLWMIARYELGESFSLSPQARALVTTGIYSKIRHPIYVFGELAYIGLFIAWGNKVGILYIAVVTPVLLFRAQREDALLEKSFGEEYGRYKAKTWF
jgi:protein-S-isoprenylcysteine O-methyltransferase Ste14